MVGLGYQFWNYFICILEQISKYIDNENELPHFQRKEVQMGERKYKCELEVSIWTLGF